MLAPAQLAALAAIHRQGSFEAAAAELHVTPSAISQRLKALEDLAGALLIRRGPPCRATEAGLRLIRHHDEVALLERDLARDLPGLAAGPARLRIAVNADSLATWVMPALAQVEGFLFDLVIDDEDVSQDWLRRGEVAAAITNQPGPLAGCDTLALGALRYRATASPGFAARWFAQGVTAETLIHAPALTFSEKDRLQHRWAAQAVDPALLRAALPCHRIASSQGFVEACRLGLGWALNPDCLVAGALQRGDLVEIAGDQPLDVPLFWQFTRLAAPALRGLTAALRDAAARTLI
ncbi:LysR family transcriptional regulator ArgP [Xinfangfangia pollutisoli]|uniref:LysR family transcriptional regulator ArgP n=1 Tax=Xinfangfangia pollutisoli TaxID=2865960 RepID=UPI001CD5893B|nr:LysR family transcriptional regulator ArgP [Xinfangfangia pollutisoli]